MVGRLGNGSTAAASRLHQYPGVTLRRDLASMGPTIAYDPHYSHLTSVDRRESSASATSSLGSFESGSTLTSDIDGDTAIMTRLRKSFEQKEEFLRRGVTQPQEAPTMKSAQFGCSTNQANQENNVDTGDCRIESIS